MKTKSVFIVLLALLLFPCISGANPIVARYFTEFTFDANGWKLEMHPSFPVLLDGWYLQSNSGRAYFKSGIRIDTGYVIITNDSLLTPLVINPSGDNLSINDSLFVKAQLTFGNAGIGAIAAPRPGQSLCVAPNITDYYWYLDNTPTLGRLNDFVNAMGILRGTVHDVSGFPVRNVQVYYRTWPDQWVYSDSAGRFTISDCARVDNFSFVHPAYQTLWQQVQIWPESTITRDFTLIQPIIYPLHVGNRWNWGFERKITGDTLMPNGKRYAMLDEPSPMQTHYPFQRFDRNIVYAYNFSGHVDQVVYDFSKSAGDTIATIIGSSDTTDIILTWSGVTDLFGRERKQWGFLRDTRHYIDEELYQIITDSIGVTHEEGMWFSADLLGAMINGVKYGTITGVPDLDRSLPIEFKLYQNHPNPFNPVTNFQFSIANSQLTILRVFDVLGREMATLVNEVKQPGTYTLQWNASGVASGVYFYRLQAGSFVDVKKLLLLK